MLVYQRVTQQFSNITLGTYINFGYPQLQGLPRGPPFQGPNCLEFSPCLKSPLKKINGTEFLKGDIFPKMGDVDDFVDVFRKPNCVFFKRDFWSYKLLHVPRTSWGFKLPPWKLRWFAHVVHQNRTDVHAFVLATVIDLIFGAHSRLEGLPFSFSGTQIAWQGCWFCGSNFFWRVTGAVCFC